MPNGPPQPAGVATKKTPTANAPIAGHKKFRLKLSKDVFRHANSGPTAVSRSKSNANGTATLLKKGGPTVTLCPCTHSDSTGNSVPHNTVKQIKRKSQLLNRKLDSREIIDSSWCSLFKCSRFFQYRYPHTARIIARNATNQSPIDDCANACTELTTPLRVRNVPKIDSMNVVNTSHMFHVFSMPRFSCIITECRKAVPVSHGISDAFSTGSHPQYPPQPSTLYAQCAPSGMPRLRNPHVTIVQRRVM